MTKFFFVVFFMTQLLVGCISTQPRQINMFTPLPFDEMEYSALPKVGTGVLKGQVFAKTVGGSVVRGAGNNVVLFPATRYGNQRYDFQVLRGMPADSAEDPRYIQFVRSTMTDADGRFTFNNVPPGKYYVISSVTWEASGYVQGGAVHSPVNITNDVITEVFLAR